MVESKYSKFDIFTCRSQFLAGMFMLLGHRLISIAPDKDDTSKNVFYFVNSDELIKHYKKYNEFKELVNPILDKLR